MAQPMNNDAMRFSGERSTPARGELLWFSGRLRLTSSAKTSIVDNRAIEQLMAPRVTQGDE